MHLMKSFRALVMPQTNKHEKDFQLAAPGNLYLRVQPAATHGI